MKNITRIAASALAVAGLSLAVAAPSFAVAPRTIATGDTYYAIPCWFPGNFPGYTLNTIASDGSSTPVGTETFPQELCQSDGSYNVLDGYYYANDWFNGEYTKVNLQTGEHTLLGSFTYPNGDDVGGDPDGTFIDNAGNHYFFNNLELYRANITDMSSTLITDALAIGVDSGQNITSIARNPVDGKYYALTVGSPGHVFEINLGTGAVVDKGAIAQCTGQNDCWGLDFDSNGVIWIQQDDENGDTDSISNLASTTLDDLTGNWVLQGAFTDTATGDWYGESTFILHAHEQADSAKLAETGFDASIPAGLGGAIALTGAIILMRRRKA